MTPKKRRGPGLLLCGLGFRSAGGALAGCRPTAYGANDGLSLGAKQGISDIAADQEVVAAQIDSGGLGERKALVGAVDRVPAAGIGK